jgi:hypothetical protein
MTKEFREAAYRSQLLAFKLTILAMLVVGALSPVFRHDFLANCVCLISVAILAVLAGVSIFK